MEQIEWVGVGTVYNYTYMASNGADRMGGGGRMYTCTWLAMEQREWVGVGMGAAYIYMASNGADRMGGGGWLEMEQIECVGGCSGGGGGGVCMHVHKWQWSRD